LPRPGCAVVLNSFCHVEGGASRVAVDEAVGLAHRGLAVDFIGAVGPVTEELTEAGVRVVCLEQQQLAAGAHDPRVGLQGLWNFAAHRAVSGILRQRDPRDTIVHLHGFTQGLSSSPVRAALQAGFKTLYTLHDYFIACPNGGFFDYVSHSPCARRPLSWACVSRNCDKRTYTHKLYRVVRSQMQRVAARLPAGVMHYIAPSARALEVLRPYLPREARVFTLGNPVEVPEAPPVDVARNHAAIAIGRLEPEKGIEVLVEAAQLARTRVRLVGEGSLRRMAEASGVCTVTGWLPREGVLAELDAARCLVFPSLCYETFGLSVAEAAARGVPSIVSDITGAADRVENDVTGWHVRAGDAADLARRLGGLREDALVSAAGRESYARFWRDPPTRARHAERLLEIYGQVLG
jgi:glycosyltransferase involved in cell wall biosynthesis